MTHCNNGSGYAISITTVDSHIKKFIHI